MKGKFVALTAALLALTMLAGCNMPGAPVSPSETEASGNTTETLNAQDIFEKMQQTVGGTMASAFTSTIDVGIQIKAAVFNMESNMSCVTDMKLSEEPYAFYSDTALEMSVLGTDIAESFQIYSHAGDDGLNSYFHIDSSDGWYHHQTSMVPTDLTGQYSLTGCTDKWFSDDMVLADQTQMIDGREAYVISCTYTAAEVLDSISSPFGDISLTGSDVFDIQLVATYYVDVETFLPVQIEIEYLQFDGLLDKLLSEFAGQSVGEAVQMQTYKEVLSGLSYGAVDVPQVPAEGVENSVGASQFRIFDFINFA